MASLIGTLVGALIGMTLIGALFGWVVHKVSRQPYETADAIGLAILAFAAGFTNSSTANSLFLMWAIYGLSALPAYFILRRLRSNPDDALSGSRSEPSFTPSADHLEDAVAVALIPDQPYRPENVWLGMARRLFHVLYVLAGIWALGFIALIWSGGGIQPGYEVLFLVAVVAPALVVAALQYVVLGFGRRKRRSTL